VKCSLNLSYAWSSKYEKRKRPIASCALLCVCVCVCKRDTTRDSELCEIYNSNFRIPRHVTLTIGYVSSVAEALIYVLLTDKMKIFVWNMHANCGTAARRWIGKPQQRYNCIIIRSKQRYMRRWNDIVMYANTSALVRWNNATTHTRWYLKLTRLSYKVCGKIYSLTYQFVGLRLFVIKF